MIATEVNILPFYTALALQHHQKWYAYGQYYCLPTPVGYLYPFQHRRTNTGDAITELVVVEVATGTETDILAIATASGLEVVEYAADGYDLIIYPATISVGSFNVGRHYLRMGDGTNTWYSEVFNFVDTTAGLVKVEWWHDGDFCYHSGSIRYNYPYKSRVYLKTDIGKPEYPYEQEVENRNGKRLKLKQISWKQYKFVFLAPEYLADAFRQVPLHDFVEITNYNDNRTHTVDEINMSNPDWQDRGDLAAITVDFQTDTVIVKSGSGVTSLDYTVGEGGCLTVDYTAVAEIGYGTSEYYGLYYIDESDGSTAYIQNGDYVLITDASSPYKRKLYGYSTVSGMVLQSPSEDEVAYDANTGTYFFFDTDEFIRPVIDSYSGGTLTGRTFPGTLASIYQVESGTHTLLDTVAASALEAGVAITTTGSPEYLYFIVQSAACPEFVASSPYEILTSGIGVGFDVVETSLIVY